MSIEGMESEQDQRLDIKDVGPDIGTEMVLDDFTREVLAKLQADRQQLQRDLDSYVPPLRHRPLAARLRLRHDNQRTSGIL